MAEISSTDLIIVEHIADEILKECHSMGYTVTQDLVSLMFILSPDPATLLFIYQNRYNKLAVNIYNRCLSDKSPVVASYFDLRGLNLSCGVLFEHMTIVVLNPENGFVKINTLTRDEIEELVRICTQKLCDNNSASLATLKIQVLYASNSKDRGTLIQEHHTNIQIRTEPLVKEIVLAHLNMTQREYSRIYRKLVVITVLLSGLGNPLNLPVLKEATAAMHSVFPGSELGRFLAIGQEEKLRQIVELGQIVAGIRLFNRDCGRGGEGIEDLPKILHDALVASIEMFENTLSSVISHVKKLCGLISRFYEDCELSVISNEQATVLKDILVMRHQQEIYIRKILADIRMSEVTTGVLMDRLQERLYVIHDTVRYRTAVPTAQVYPQFKSLAEIWTELQDEIVVLGTYTNTLWHIQNIGRALIESSEVFLMSGSASQEEIPSQPQITPPIDQSEISTCEVIFPCEVIDFDEIQKQIQYRGFCAYSLVEYESALFPADFSIGVLKYNGTYFAFVNTKAALNFAKDPQRYWCNGLMILQKKGELLELLQMTRQIGNMTSICNLVKQAKDSKDVDAEVQTEVHPIESYWDPKYMSSIWDLKRDACKLTTIVKHYMTHSTQTVKSHWRQGMGTQTIEPLNSRACQTRRDNSTNVPRLSNFLYGLRGRKDNVQHVITLTRPVDERFHCSYLPVSSSTNKATNTKLPKAKLPVLTSVHDSVEVISK